MDGQYVDKKCPFTSNVSIRGRIFKGVVLSNKMARTVVLRRDYLHFIKKYQRFEKRHHNLPAHLSPAFARTRTGDIVTVGQCRPISKTVRFNVLRVEKQRVEGNVRKTFVMFWVSGSPDLRIWAIIFRWAVHILQQLRVKNWQIPLYWQAWSCGHLQMIMNLHFCKNMS